MSSDDARLQFLVDYYRGEFCDQLMQAMGPRIPDAPSDSDAAVKRTWAATAAVLATLDGLKLDGRETIPALAQALGGMCRAAANAKAGRDDPVLAQACLLFVVFMGLEIAGSPQTFVDVAEPKGDG